MLCAMATKNKTGGYNFKAEVARGLLATATARAALRRILNENPGPLTEAQLLGRAGTELGEIESAFREIEKIAQSDKKGA